MLSITNLLMVDYFFYIPVVLCVICLLAPITDFKDNLYHKRVGNNPTYSLTWDTIKSLFGYFAICTLIFCIYLPIRFLILALIHLHGTI